MQAMWHSFDAEQVEPSATSSTTFSSIITTCDRNVHQAQYHITTIATSCMQAQHYTTRGLSSSPTPPLVLSRQLRCLAREARQL
ncbi:hypothetical protein C8R45DRAFT_1090789 [Mycena sanguinolenta]|nr:hypothetical protein C8R45DRAFT_1090789 [Mycena sanguinolenta]